MRKKTCRPSRSLPRAVFLTLCFTLGLFVHSLPVSASAVSLAPLVSGVFNSGDGANSYWAQVQDTWKGPSSFSQDFGGISTLQDANVALGMTSGDAGFLRSATGVISDINAGNDVYNSLWGSGWGFADMPPLFGTGDPQQENYAGHIWGYLSVPEAGNYNLGVLYDDGFAFTLWGADGSRNMFVDGLNPRDRKGFDYDLALGVGLYRFDLMGYNRLEAGVLNLGWWSPMTPDFGIIPQANLYTTAPVPLPAAAWLFGSGLVGLIGFARRKK